MTRPTTVPRHVVLFPDGNRRWAKARGLHPLRGHMRGKENSERFLSWCKKAGVEIVTVFGFSTENWGRSPQEVSYLMQLFARFLSDKKGVAQFRKEGVRVTVIGQRERLPRSLQKVVRRIERLTQHNTDLRLNLAVSYGGRWDITNAVKKIVRKKIAPQKITEKIVSDHLSTAGLPEPDLIIRAGGQLRLSNFVLWQAAYAELYFSPKYWPDFTEKDFDKALREYARRTRRFGH